MKDNEFRRALSQACESRLALASDCPEIPDDYHFSDRFESSMRQAGLSRCISVSRRPKLWHRVRIGLFIAVIFAAGFCLGMGRMPLWNYVVHNTDKGRAISFDLSTADDPKKKIEEVYTFTGAPEGYICEGTETCNLYTHEIWTKKKSETETETGIIFFAQYIPAIYRDAIITEETECEYFIVDGIQYYLMTEPDSSYTGIVWYNGDYVFLLSGDFNKDEAIDLCKTVKLKEE